MRHLTIVKLFMLALMLSGLHTLPVTAKNVSVLEFGAKPDAARMTPAHCARQPSTAATIPVQLLQFRPEHTACAMPQPNNWNSRCCQEKWAVTLRK